MDLITCRNVLIYLEAPVQKNVISVFHYASVLTDFSCWAMRKAWARSAICFRCRIGPTNLSKRSTAIRPGVAFSTWLSSRGESRRLRKRPHVVTGGASSNAAEAEKEFDRRLLQRYAPAAVFVDEALEIVHSRGDVDRYL